MPNLGVRVRALPRLVLWLSCGLGLMLGTATASHAAGAVAAPAPVPAATDEPAPGSPDDGELPPPEPPARPEPEPEPEPEPPAPPRIDGAYVGAVLFTGVTLARVNDLVTDGPFVAFGGTLRFGEMVLPWLGLGLAVGGNGGAHTQDGARQGLGQGALAVDASFVPAPKRLPLLLRASFGFGGGAIAEAGTSGRAGFGGAMFGAAARYEWFPWAKARRPFRGGGFGLGPELGWIGFTPAAAGRPMSNTIYLAIATTFYFGS